MNEAKSNESNKWIKTKKQMILLKNERIWPSANSPTNIRKNQQSMCTYNYDVRSLNKYLL
jgi:hypothetical protein